MFAGCTQQRLDVQAQEEPFTEVQAQNLLLMFKTYNNLILSMSRHLQEVKMLALAKVTKRMFYDLGSGDGRILITAAQSSRPRGHRHRY